MTDASIRVLIPDTWHFHRRNFAALLYALHSNFTDIYTDRSGRRLWKAHGHYDGHRALLMKWLPDISRVTRAEVASFEYRGINLFRCVRSELMCRFLPLWGVQQGFGPNSDGNIVERVWSNPHAREALHLCMAAACYWIDHWERILKDRGPFSHALVFSGSYIYTRALQETAARSGTRVFTLEGFFTGHAFYLEERATPISNNSQLAGAELLRRLALPEDPIARARLRGEAHRRLAGMRNKNVRADKNEIMPRPFDDRGSGTVLIVGQVMNDFSLIETPLAEASSVEFYRRLITRLLAETALTIIFKAHPWERRRYNLRAPVTLTQLTAFVDQLEPRKRARIKLLENEPIGAVFGHVDRVVGLCSQGLLEACQAGFKPMQAGKAFFGGRGFTHDFENADQVADALVADNLPARLLLGDYRLFEDFLVRSLVLHLVSNLPCESDKAWQMISKPAGWMYSWQEADRQIAGKPPSSILAPLWSVLLHPGGWIRLAWSSMPRLASRARVMRKRR